MKRLPTTIAFCFLAASFAFSQKSEPDSVAWSVNLDDIVVTAQYAPTDSRNAVHRVRIIKQEVFEQRGATNLEQLLRQELNIRISQDLILGSSMNLQGISGQNVQIMIDGVPVIGRVGGNIDLSQIDLHNIERVEIVEGPLSVNYGTDALGGVINLISKKSQLHRFDAELTAQAESIGRLNLNAAFGLRPTEQLLFRFHGGRYNFDGYNSAKVDSGETQPRDYQWNPKEQWFAGGSVRYDFAEDHNVRYSANWFDEEVQNVGAVRRPQFMPYAFDDIYRTRRFEHSLHQEGTIARKYFLQTTLGYNFFERKKNTMRLDFDSEEQNEVEGQQDTTRFNAFVWRPVIASKFENSKLNFQFGLDLHYENGFGKRIQDEKSKKPNFSQLGDYAVFGSLQYQPASNLSVQLGARAAKNTRFDAPVVPSLNLKYAPSSTVTLRASYAKGFRSPSLKELFFNFVDANHFIIGNPQLNAETSDNFQLSFNWKPHSKKHPIEVSAAAFFNDIRDKIDLFEFVEVDGAIVPAAQLGQSSTQFAYFNQSRHKTIGGDLRLRYSYQNLDLHFGFSPIGRYNLLSQTASDVSPFTFVTETNGEIIYRFPKQDLQLSLFVKYNDKLVRYFQDFDDEGNPVPGEQIQDGFTLSDFTISKQFRNRSIQVVGGVQNLFNVQNVSVSGGGGGAHSGGGGTAAVGMGRSYFVRLAWHYGWD